MIALSVLAFASETPVGTIGSELSVVFDQDVGSKPKLLLTYDGPLVGAKGDPKAKAKLVSSDGTNVTFVIQAAKGGGLFEVGVKGGDASGGPIALSGPSIEEWDDTAPAGGELLLMGSYFGELANRRSAPKVYIGGKKAKVTAFSDTELTIVLHKKTPQGLQDIRIVNKVGEETIVGGVSVTLPPKPIKGKDSMSGKIDGSKFKATDKNTVAAAVFNPGANTLVITGANRSGSRTSPRVRTFAISLISLGAPIDQIVTPLVLTGNQAGIATLSDVQTRLTGSNPGATTTLYDSSGARPLTVTIDSVAGDRISGSFSCQMGEAGGSKVIDASGTFVLTLE